MYRVVQQGPGRQPQMTASFKGLEAAAVDRTAIATRNQQAPMKHNDATPRRARVSASRDGPRISQN